jgi:hypothetical protein
LLLALASQGIVDEDCHSPCAMAQSIGSTTDGLKKDRDHSLTIVIQKIDPAIFRIACLSCGMLSRDLLVSMT